MRVTVSTHTSEAPAATSDTPAADRLGGAGVAGGGQGDEDGEQQGGPGQRGGHRVRERPGARRALFGQGSHGGPDLGPAGQVVVHRGVLPARPISSRTRRGSRVTSCPATMAVPESGLGRVARSRTAVVLPAPFGPRRAHTVPPGTLKPSPSRAWTRPVA